MEFAGMWVNGSCPVQPGDDPKQVVRSMVDHGRGCLVNATGGEWRRPTPEEVARGVIGEENWVVPWTNEALRRLGFKVKPDEGSKYVDFYKRIFKVSVLHRRKVVRGIKAGLLPQLPYAAFAQEDFPTIEVVESETGQQFIKVRGFASPWALKTFMGLPLGCMEYFEWLYINKLIEFCQQYPTAVVQWELPTEYAFASVPGVSKRMAYGAMRVFARMIAQCPSGSKHAFHATCRGDLRRRPFVPRWAQRYKTSVLVINAIVELPMWRHNGGDHELVAIQDSHCDGRYPPRMTWRVRRAYRKLQGLPPDTLYVIGVLRPDSGFLDVVEYCDQLLQVLCGKVSRFALSSSCGDGRLSHKATDAQYRVGATVCKHYMPERA